MIYNCVTEIIGKTPIMELKNYEKKHGLKTKILAKLEYLNPAGSIKDRAALYMINNAEKSGRIKAGATVIEPTSGNTGIGLAMVCKAKGYKLILTMPETMSVERQKLVKAYGAEVVLTEGSKGMLGSIEKAKELNRQIEGSMIAGQFENDANAQAHRETTGPEIWNDTAGKVDILIATVGSGGTITGTGEYLKSKNPKIKVYAVEPESSPLLSKGRVGAHKIQGIGANFIPPLLNTSVYDGVITVSDSDAFAYGKELAETEAVLCGISSGAALKAATVMAEKPENYGKNIVVILPDSGDRYLSTDLF